MTKALGFDFGTTNSVLAASQGQTTRSELHQLRRHWRQHAHGAVLYEACAARGFCPEGRSRTGRHPRIHRQSGEVRFLQSIKTFAASPLFQGTLIFAKRNGFRDLMRAFVSRIADYAGNGWEGGYKRLVVGRPVHFAGSNPDENLALERYNKALSTFGFPEIHFVYEPVAAAFYFAQSLKRDATVLVADFGSGTTDYSIIRFDHAGHLTAVPVGHSGVGVAGDHFDFRIIDNVVSPLIGKGSQFRSFDKLLDVPTSYYANFGRWNQLSIFKTLKDFTDLKQLVRSAVEPEKLERFIDLVDHDEGYPLYQAISAAKMRLSSEEETEFHFAPLGESRRVIRRNDFNWIAPDIARIETALDDVFEKTGTKPADIDKVFLTGGTSFVPAVRRLFENRFDKGDIESGGELLSIAHGLALIGERDDIDRWTAMAA